MSLEKLTSEDSDALENETAELIGESDWVKNSCYVVYKCPSGKYALQVLVNPMSCWSETLGYIDEQDIEKYVKRK